MAREYRRYPFERADLEAAARAIELLADSVRLDLFSGPAPESFELNKEYVLTRIDECVPPSDAKEAIHAAARALAYGCPPSTSEALCALSRRVRRVQLCRRRSTGV